MGEVISLEERRRARVPAVDRLESAVDTLERVTEGRRMKVAPAWLRAGVAEVRRLLRSRDLAQAAEQAEQLVLRLGSDPKAG